MRKLIRLLLGLAAFAVLLVYGYKLADYLMEADASSRLNESLADSAVIERLAEEQIPQSFSAGTDTPDGTAPLETVPMETAPIEVDFEVLLETSEDIVGWLYCEDTPISLPVAQAEDNSYYLRRLLDGSWNSAGTLFADYRNTGDFSDGNTIIYGHNMKNDSMFGTLPEYGKQEYYEEHPVMWLLTPEGDYKVELVAGYVTSSTSEIYTFDQSDEEVLALVQKAVEASTFQTGISLIPGDRYLTLSTCSYEYDNARYVLVGRLVPLF